MYGEGLKGEGLIVSSLGEGLMPNGKGELFPLRAWVGTNLCKCLTYSTVYSINWDKQKPVMNAAVCHRGDKALFMYSL